ncbi:2749_t:CDS:2 [Diversispora eburnea]|uniref:2749_t:CDS:1 n=1 Tax=Diversispora eburnea TaxID=1213867 RepID=A0A9N8V3N9_9GLOM|nr:2749_t:CDS:2 [Diversispora eburnea]
MADPNAHHLNQHYLTQQSPPPPTPPQQQRGNQLVGNSVPHLMIDPNMQQVALAAAPPPPMQHQFQPQHYNVLDNFWQQQVNEIRHGDHDFKVHQLPLARIKKVMKTDEEVKAPILFAKACDVFITELTMRAWLNAEECKRRTLQRSDIASAIKKIDMFDFLIDIVPREEKMNVKTEKV